MRKDILYPYALDKGGLIVKAVDAPRSDIYSCIGCAERMVLRRGEIKRPYFAHYTENLNCKPETVLHKMAKDTIKAGIDTALSLNFEYPFNWRCPVCNQEHSGDLARSTREVKTEVSLDGVRPDILLSSIKEKPLVAIEVVVTHSPEQEAIEAYKRLKLPVLLVEPEWEDLEKLKSGLGMVEAWQAPCRAKRCPKCHGPMEEVIVGAFAGHKCDKCGKPVLAFGLVMGSGGYFPDWTPGMFKPAKSVGVNLKSITIAKDGTKVTVLKCNACGYSDDVSWYRDPWFDDVVMHDCSAVKTKPYYRCEKCDTWLEKIRTVKPMTALETLNPCDREKGASNE